MAKKVKVKKDRRCKICGKKIVRGEYAVQLLRCTKWGSKVSHICLDCYRRELIVYQPVIIYKR